MPARRSAGMRAPSADNTPRSPKKADKGRDSGPRRDKRGGGSKSQGRGQVNGRGREGGAGWIWGLHAVRAALANPRRTIHDVMVTDTALSRIDLPDGAPQPRIVLPAQLDREFGQGHQGVAIKAAPLEWPDIIDLAAQDEENGLILVLDQITDPHNVGAMLRLCSAFGVRALVMQTRKAPPLSGAAAKVAVGCVETVPVCLVTNIANTLQDLQKQHWIVTGLAGETDIELSQALSGGGNHVIVMGAEGPGLRTRVRDNCDQLARIPMLSSDVAGEAESLNVATAAGIALYEVRRR
ncbi:MAG: TrmH family RNA methyltransferase [Alphaproteobacteria bacterium]